MSDAGHRVAAHKIFCVGTHRTGTSSLIRALRLLGYRTSHWRHRKEILADVEQGNYRLRLMERVDAVGDLPIPCLYRELDTAFPEGIFVLTVRHPQSWIVSAERHMCGRALEPEERMFYGVDAFDKSHMLGVYERHNRDVIEHFRGQGNLLVFNVTAGDGWEKLCPFVGVPAGQSLPCFPWESHGDGIVP